MNSFTTVVVVFSLLRISIALDTINVNKKIRDGETITSASNWVSSVPGLRASKLRMNE